MTIMVSKHLVISVLLTVVQVIFLFPLQEKIENVSQPTHSLSLIQESTIKMQRVLVFLAGLHKPAYSSIQQNMVTWKSSIWPYQNLDMAFAHSLQNNSCKTKLDQLVFNSWSQDLIGKDSDKLVCLTHFDDGKVIYSRQEFIDIYKREFYEQWMKGCSLVISSKEMAKMLVFLEILFSNFLGIWIISNQLVVPMIMSQESAGGINDHVTAVVVCRSPAKTSPNPFTSVWWLLIWP